MTMLLSWSTRLYTGLMFLYPARLRRDYGPEMALVFTEDLEAAWRARRVHGFTRVWLNAIAEIVTVAAPALRGNPCVVVPAISFAMTASFQMLALIAASGDAAKDLAAPAQIVVAVMVIGAMNAAVAVPASIPSRWTSLQLDSRA
jgi:hypothetical protein